MPTRNFSVRSEGSLEAATDAAEAKSAETDKPPPFEGGRSQLADSNC